MDDFSKMMEKEYSKYEDIDRITKDALSLFFTGWEEKSDDEVLFAHTALAFTIGRYYNNKIEMFRQLNASTYALYTKFHFDRTRDPDYKMSEMPINYWRTTTQNETKDCDIPSLDLLDILEIKDDFEEANRIINAVLSSSFAPAKKTNKKKDIFLSRSVLSFVVGEFFFEQDKMYEQLNMTSYYLSSYFLLNMIIDANSDTQKKSLISLAQKNSIKKDDLKKYFFIFALIAVFVFSIYLLDRPAEVIFGK